MTITKGLLTYEAEGTEGGRFHSRKLHVPTEQSGLTLGRGYDMKRRKSSKIKTDLCKAGVGDEDATVLSEAASLKGKDAERFITDNNLEQFEISIETQEKLFITIYEEIAIQVKRAFNKADCIKTYGKVDWEQLNITIKDIVIDLRYRGDYTSASRKLILTLIVNNDQSGIARTLSIRAFWTSVPEERFQKRIDFLSKATEANKAPECKNAENETHLPDAETQNLKFYSKILLWLKKTFTTEFSS